MAQTLVIGPNQLLDEGPSDVVYLTVMSEVVREAGGTPLDPNWTITPVGGLDKVPSFVSLLGSSDLSIAVLMDVAGSGNQRIAQLVSRGLLDKGRLVYLTEFTTRAKPTLRTSSPRAGTSSSCPPRRRPTVVGSTTTSPPAI